MARLGELLIEGSVLAPEQIDHGLRAQVVWGGRLGTNLIELGYIDLETLTRVLGRQHGVPAAHGRHFDKADPALQARLPRELAERWSVVPLLYLGPDLGPDRKIALVSIDPLGDDALATLAEVFEADPAGLISSVAAELRVRYHLERVYGIKRSARFLRAKGKSVTPFPELGEFADEEPSGVEIQALPKQAPAPPPPVRTTREPTPAEIDEITAQIDAEIDAQIDAQLSLATAAPDPVGEPAGRDRRTYVKTLADMVDAPPSVGAPPPFDPATNAETVAPSGAETTQPVLARMAIRRVAVPTPPNAVPAVEMPRDANSLPDAARAIRRGPNRDRVGDLVVDALERFAPMCDAAVVLVIRGDVATGWKHFCRDGQPSPELAVPIDQPGLVPAAIEANATMRRGAEALDAIDRLLLRALGKDDGELVVVPVAIAGKVICVIATATAVDAEVAPVEAIAAAAGTAFTRLIRDASR